LKSSSRIRKIGRLYHSRKALAIPVTFLILFVSTLFMVAVTYYFAVERISAKSQSIKVSLARENMMNLDEDVSSVLWQSTSSRTLDFSDCGGQLNVEPSINQLSINITDNNSIYSTVFNDTVGCVVYELPYSETSDTGLFLKGDSRAVLNQSGYSMTQLYIRKGVQRAEILLQYRPIVSYVATGTEGNKTVSNVRIYVVSLNSSQSIELFGRVPLRITCESTVNSVTSYDVDYQPSPLIVTASIGEFNGQVPVPISSTSYGAIINVELVLCKVQIERWVR
jgi:hypothetical protein